MTSGYYRFPTIHNNWVVFVSEDDLWRVPAEGGLAQRLTSNLGRVSYPRFSPDGRWLSYLGREEGLEEIYLMPSDGGASRRLTYIGGRLCRNAGWTPDGQAVFSSPFGKPILRFQELSKVSTEGGVPQPLGVGPARAISFGSGGGIVIGRNTDDPRHWKRDRGGMTGTIWIDKNGSGEYKKLIDLAGDLGSPMWVNERIYFLSDHDGIGNLYSCTPDGDDLQQHTQHDTYYAYNADSDGKNIVYHSGADLYRYDPIGQAGHKIEVQYPSSRTQRNRKFVSAQQYLDSWTLKPDGREIAITTRGKPFSLPNWEGAVQEYTQQDGVRCRLLTWLHDGKRLIGLTDEGGEEQWTIFDSGGLQPPERLPWMDIGRVMHISVSPKNDHIVFSNQRRELFFLDLAANNLVQIDRGDSKRLMKDTWNSLRAVNTITFDWSPDGKWVAYSVTVSKHGSQIRLWHVDQQKSFPVTRPEMFDEAPSFDPDGRFLYFISYRHLDPVPDSLHFEFSFPNSIKPCLVTLQKEIRSPFEPLPDEPASRIESGSLRIDLEGIQERILAFPVENGIYLRIRGSRQKVLFTRFPITSLKEIWGGGETFPTAKLQVYDLTTREEKTLLPEVHDFKVSREGNWLLCKLFDKLRVIQMDNVPTGEAGAQPGRKSGWVDLGRVKVSIDPGAEWRQMYREAWRLQRELYWVENMSHVDWPLVHDRYLPLVKRVNCRSELSALIWEMQSELGIGHAYEDGGDYRPHPDYALGHLGADFTYHADLEGWEITHIVRGDSWNAAQNSPLHAPGIDLQLGDVLLGVNGQRLGRQKPPSAALVNQAGGYVRLTFACRGEEPSKTRDVTVRTLRDEMPARYREWVLGNRQIVHEATGGRAGYLHLPDMEIDGLIEFHRGFFEEMKRDGLIVDVRYNTGGMISPLLLEKLDRRRRHIGFNRTRWTKTPEPYPYDAILGPMVAIANECTGSDGDLFSNGFKMMGLGPLIGKRTWGGVVSIGPRNPLVDGTKTTQPENAFWFFDVGWGIENHGVEPDIEAENLPQDYARGFDRQLQRAIEEILMLMRSQPARQPDFEPPPDRSIPKKWT